LNEIEEVKARLDIAEVVGQYVQLQKAGRSFKGLCPFHTEKTPSFVVTPDRQTWHCFGACGTGGDVISFVMKKEGIEFPEALASLAERAGVELRQGAHSRKETREHDRLYAANDAAATLFHQTLEESDLAGEARAYLERRGVDHVTSESFQLGYSQDSWDAARDHLRSEGFRDEELIAAGLTIEGEQSPYDRFRGRLMFPIWDPKGRVVGFGARALDDSMPKYLNTPQTPIFDKGGILYAFDRARSTIREEQRAVVVEGYMDVIAAHQFGFTNVVASMGTALTEPQVRLLKKATPSVVLALDADTAGTEAAIRGHEVVRESADGDSAEPSISWRGLVGYESSASIELTVAILPGGSDPDDVIRDDSGAWQQLVDSATPVLDFRLKSATDRHNLESPTGRSALVKEFLPLVKAVADPVVRAHYLQRLSARARIGERELSTMLIRSTDRRASRRTQETAAEPGQRGDVREEFLLALLLRYPEVRRDGLEVRSELLWQTENRQIFDTWRQFERSNDVKNALPMELRPHLLRLEERRLPSYDTKEAVAALYDCVAKLVTRQTKADKQSSEALLSAIEETMGPNDRSTPDDSNRDDEAAREFEGALSRDTEAGLRLHERERSDPESRIETGANG
jgi:DNA primase